jgi:mannose-6-phosphate isomerase-like protein (cupin superfamily)
MRTQQFAPALFTLAEATRAENEPGRISAKLFQHGSMQLRFYAPPDPDPQIPHPQDELYVVARGTGVFSRAGEKVVFGPGDVLFVAAGVEHRFHDFSPDFATWVIFYGPPGGEELPT